MEKPKWASDHNLEVCGQYYQGFVDDYKAVLSQHCMATVTTYGVRKSRTNASAGTDQEKENEAGNTIQTSEVSINKGHNYINIHSDNKSLCLNSQKIRIYWQKKEGCKTIEFNNIPFSVAEEKLLDCQFGPKYFKQKPVQGKRLWLQSTRKIGCNAHVEVKAFTLYPEFAITQGEREGLSKWKLRCLQEEKIKMIKTDLEAKQSVKTTKKYFISLP